MKGRFKWITLGIWLVGSIIVFVVTHQFELTSIASDPEAEQKFKGYSSFISGDYNVYRVVAVTVFGSAIIYWVISFIAKTVEKMTAKKTAEKMMR